MWLGNRDWSANEVMARTGRLQQLCGVRAVRLTEGAEAGVRAVDLYTERLRVSVYPDRGMDVGTLLYRGLPLTWESPTGVVHPALVDTSGHGWGKGFHGGLAATCGLENAGPACEDEESHFGQHGTLSYTPANSVRWTERRAGGLIQPEVEGHVPGAGGLRFHRKVWLQSGSDSVWIRDRVQNPLPRPVPWMIQYHMNFGFPLLSEGAVLLIPPGRPEPRDQASASGLSSWDQVEGPQPEYHEQVFRHRQEPDRKGRAACALINEGLGLGVMLTYPAVHLPYLWQWRVFAPQRYVMALEPSNCFVKPRSRARSEGVLPQIAAFSQVEMLLEVRVVEGKERLRRLRTALIG